MKYAPLRSKRGVNSGVQVSLGELEPSSCSSESAEPTAAAVNMSSKAGR